MALENNIELVGFPFVVEYVDLRGYRHCKFMMKIRWFLTSIMNILDRCGIVIHDLMIGFVESPMIDMSV